MPGKVNDSVRALSMLAWVRQRCDHQFCRQPDHCNLNVQAGDHSRHVQSIRLLAQLP